jgi:peptidoglycan/xylan/chitin deacetylase (PgdA/CDA1 family)
MEPRPYGPFPYTPINRRPKITWPDGARVALWVIPNIEIFALDETMPGGPGGSNGRIPDVHTWAIRDYGARVGIFRHMEVLSKHGIRATVALNSEVCDQYPEIIEDARALDWDYMGHNQSNTRRLNNIPPETERDVVLSTLSRIEEATGVKPAGWLGSGLQETWNTLDHLIEGGCSYVADWVNDDQPYMMDIDGKSLVSLPYSAQINDKPQIEAFNRTAAEFGQMIRDQFDVLYREGEQSGRVMAISLHPYITGVPHRIGALDDALAYICSHDHVWKATGREITDHYLNSGATF